MDESSRPVIFEQRFENTRQPIEVSSSSVQGGLHIVFLLHGFMGTKWDVRIFHQVLSFLDIQNMRSKALQSIEDLSEWDLQVG